MPRLILMKMERNKSSFEIGMKEEDAMENLVRMFDVFSVLVLFCLFVKSFHFDRIDKSETNGKENAIVC